MAVIVGLVLVADDIVLHAEGEQKQEKPRLLEFLIPIIIIMVIISVMGSGFYYSLPQGENVNWYLIRAFYTVGLIAAGFIYDKSRFIGSLTAVASLTYPLIATALYDDVNGTVVLSLSYLFRGFLSVYCICAFTDYGTRNSRLLPLAPLGLCISRITEGLLSFLLIYLNIPDIAVLIVTAIFFVPLIIYLLCITTSSICRRHSRKKTFTLFCENFGLTAREAEVLQCLTDGFSDDEISNKIYISKSTVRFHISNIMNKTGCHTRV